MFEKLHVSLVVSKGLFTVLWQGKCTSQMKARDMEGGRSLCGYDRNEYQLEE